MLSLIFDICVSSSHHIEVLNRDRAIFISGDKQSCSRLNMMNMDRFAREAPIILWCISGVSLLRLRFSMLLATLILNLFLVSFNKFFIIIVAFCTATRGTVAVSVGPWLP